jgi:hypothetical protein
MDDGTGEVWRSMELAYDAGLRAILQRRRVLEAVLWPCTPGPWAIRQSHISVTVGKRRSSGSGNLPADMRLTN